jgi:hypothetical protein
MGRGLKGCLAFSSANSGALCLIGSTRRYIRVLLSEDVLPHLDKG